MTAAASGTTAADSGGAEAVRNGRAAAVSSASSSATSSSASPLSASSAAAAVPPTLIVENGGGTVKLGLFSNTDVAPAPAVQHNAMARTPERHKRAAVGGAIDELDDFSGLRFVRPLERGLLTRLDVQADIWRALFKQQQQQQDLRHVRLMLSVPPLCPASLLDGLARMAFDEFGVAALCLVSPAQAIVYGAAAGAATPNERGERAENVPALARTGMVLDSGFSFTHAVPVFDGTPLNYAVRRLDVGGKLLTNYLKELVSYRAWNMMDETYLMNVIKERMCYVADDFDAELERCRRERDRGNNDDDDEGIAASYVLPDYTSATHRLGHVLESRRRRQQRQQQPEQAAALDKANDEAAAAADAAEAQILPLTNERFTVPEALFSPADVLNLPRCGAAELVMQSLQRVPRALWPPLLDNVLLAGGNVNLPGFAARFERELRARAPADMRVRVRVAAPDAVTAAWHGMARMCVEEAQAQRAHVSRSWEQDVGVGGGGGSGGDGGAGGGGGAGAATITRAEYRENGARICRYRSFTAL